MKRFNVNTASLMSFLFLVLLGGIGFYMYTSYKDNAESVSEMNEANKENADAQVADVKIVDIDSTSRPYAVMINNIGVARTVQSGLQDAYLVYEIIVEGGITRFLALYKDVRTERIGSIRSARHYFLDYALENDAIYVHHGQSPQAQRDFSTLGVDRITVGNTGTGWRDKSLKVASEHTLFTSIEKLESGLGKKRTETNKDLLLDYSAKSIDYTALNGVKDANSVDIVYSKSNAVNYVYDKENMVYKRSVNGSKHVDYVTKKQYTVKNIITYQVSNSTVAGDSSGRQELDNIGSGSGWLITEGKAVPIRWSKESRNAQTKYTYENGNEIIVNDGNTFIQIQPTKQKLTIK